MGSWPVRGWCAVARLLGTHRYRPDGGTQVAPSDLRGEYGGRSFSSRTHDSSSGRVWQRSAGPLRAPGDVRLPARRADRPVGRIAGPGRLAGPHVSQRAGYAGHPTTCPAVRITKTFEAVCVQDAVSECRRRPAPLPRRLSRSVIDSIGPASAEFALPADYEGPSIRVPFGQLIPDRPVRCAVGNHHGVPRRAPRPEVLDAVHPMDAAHHPLQAWPCPPCHPAATSTPRAGQDPRRRAVRAGKRQQRTGQPRSSRCRTTAPPWRPAAPGARTGLLSLGGSWRFWAPRLPSGQSRGPVTWPTSIRCPSGSRR
jgi:hypothetical protein